VAGPTPAFPTKLWGGMCERSNGKDDKKQKEILKLHLEKLDIEIFKFLSRGKRDESKT